MKTKEAITELMYKNSTDTWDGVLIDFKEIHSLIDKLDSLFSLHVVVDRLPTDPIVLARYLHESYEMLAKNNDWNTQENCKVDFSDLPIGNKNTMILLAGKLILDFRGN